jgi:hypothetical protein
MLIVAVSVGNRFVTHFGLFRGSAVDPKLNQYSYLIKTIKILFLMKVEETMNSYSIALFLHISGALGFFVVLGLEWIGLRQIRSSSLSEEAHTILGMLKSTNRLAFVCMLTLIITGFYMMLTVWHGVPWILVVLGALVLETVLFVALTTPRVTAIGQALAEEKGPLSQSFYKLANHPVLWLSIQTRVAILLGMIFLKIAKPDLGGSLLTIGIAIVLGLASALPVLRPARAFMAFFVTALVAAVVLLAANSISARTTTLTGTPSDNQEVQTEAAITKTEAVFSNLPTQAPTPFPQTALQEGQLLLQDRCTQCHPLQKVLQVKRTRTEWEKILSEMESFNVKISDPEKEVLLGYLISVDNP